jgi:hypothetical protein
MIMMLTLSPHDLTREKTPVGALFLAWHIRTAKSIPIIVGSPLEFNIQKIRIASAFPAAV